MARVSDTKYVFADSGSLQATETDVVVSDMILILNVAPVINTLKHMLTKSFGLPNGPLYDAFRCGQNIL